jgi:hypothetical protein
MSQARNLEVRTLVLCVKLSSNVFILDYSHLYIDLMNMELFNRKIDFQVSAHNKIFRRIFNNVGIHTLY